MNLMLGGRLIIITGSTSSNSSLTNVKTFPVVEDDILEFLFKAIFNKVMHRNLLMSRKIEFWARGSKKLLEFRQNK